MESPVITEINKMVASQFPELDLAFSSPGKSTNIWIIVMIIVIAIGLLLYYRKSD